MSLPTRCPLGALVLGLLLTSPVAAHAQEKEKPLPGFPDLE